MVIEDDHESDLRECLDSDIEDFHASFTDQLGVGSEVFSRDWFVVKVELERISEADAVHLKFVPNIHCDVSHFPELKPIDAVPTHVSP